MNMTMTLSALLSQCAPEVAPSTLAAIVSVESGGNAFAIGVNKGQQVRQPRNATEAIAIAKGLLARAARDQAIAEATLGVAAARSEGLSRLSDRLGTAATAKEVADLTARAAIEAAAAANQTNQLMALEMGRQADARARNAAAVAASDAALRTSIERDRARARSRR